MENETQNMVTILKTSDLENIISTMVEVNEKVDYLLQNAQNNSAKYISSEEVCEMLQISSRTLQKYRDEGRIRFAKLDRKIIYKLQDIEDFVEANMIETDY